MVPLVPPPLFCVTVHVSTGVPGLLALLSKRNSSAAHTTYRHQQSGPTQDKKARTCAATVLKVEDVILQMQRGAVSGCHSLQAVAACLDFAPEQIASRLVVHACIETGLGCEACNMHAAVAPPLRLPNGE